MYMDVECRICDQHISKCDKRQHLSFSYAPPPKPNSLQLRIYHDKIVDPPCKIKMKRRITNREINGYV